jgi:hypothetical protein
MLDPITELILIKEGKNKTLLNEFGLLTWLAAAGVAAFVTPKITRFIQQYKKLKRECSELKGTEKEDCIDSVKAGFNRNALFILRQARTECGRTTEPERCKDEIDKRIRMFTY